MGKRKHVKEEAIEVLEEERQDIPGTSNNGVSGYSFKRIKREWQDEILDGKEEFNSYVNSSNSFLNGHNDNSIPQLNGSLPDEVEREEKQHVWLIRKPKNVSLDDLYQIQFSRKSKYKVQRVRQLDKELITEMELVCHLEQPNRQMLHVATKQTKEKFDAKTVMHSESHLRGYVWISENHSRLELTQATEEEIEIESNASPSSFQFSSIRRKPMVDETRLKERLKAFGMEETSIEAVNKKQSSGLHKEKKRTNQKKRERIKQEIELVDD